MNSRDYKIIANTMSKTYTKKDGKVWGEIVVALCEAMQEDNPLFDKERFIDACEKDWRTDGS